jgi:translation initiation factor IF-2
MDSEKSARDYSRLRKQKSRDKKMLQTKVKPLDQMFEEAKTGEQEIVLNIVLKADTHGAVEALSESVKKLSNEQITIKVIGSGVGMINETDVNLALASSAMVVGFNVRADFGANKLLQSSGIDPFYCSVIYDLIEKIKAQVKGMEEPVFVEEVVGKVDVREVFRSSKFGVVAGCMVTHGFVKKNICVRVLRDGVVIHQGIVNSLRRSKDDVTEVKAGIECGIGVKDYTDMRSGDELEVYINKKQ